MIHCNYEVRDKDIASVASKQQQVYGLLNWADQGATECGALNVININNNMGLEKARDKEKRYGDDKTTFKTKSVLLIVYHLCVKHVSNRTYKLKCLHGHVVMSFTNFQNVHTIITTDSMNVSGRTVHYIFFSVWCACERASMSIWVHKHLNDTNNVIRTLCSNYTNTCSQIDDSTGFVRIEKFYLEITLSFEHSTHIARSHSRLCVHVVLTGRNGSLVVSSLFTPHILRSSRQIFEHDSVNGCYVISL